MYCQADVLQQRVQVTTLECRGQQALGSEERAKPYQNGDALPGQEALDGKIHARMVWRAAAASTTRFMPTGGGAARGPLPEPGSYPR